MAGNNIHSPYFISALADYYYLICKNYPGKLALKMVGDRYKLSGDVRTVLFRGVFSDRENLERSRKITTDLSNQILQIDFYNFLFTMLNYKLGKLVFVSTDLFCRDAGSLFGKIKKESYFIETSTQIMNFLNKIKAAYIIFYIDSPVSFSREHQAMLESKFSGLDLMIETRLVKSADLELKNQKEGILCTSDSVIIDATYLPTADLPKMALNYFYKSDLINLSLILDSLQIS